MILRAEIENVWLVYICTYNQIDRIARRVSKILFQLPWDIVLFHLIYCLCITPGSAGEPCTNTRVVLHYMKTLSQGQGICISVCVLYTADKVLPKSGSRLGRVTGCTTSTCMNVNWITSLFAPLIQMKQPSLRRCNSSLSEGSVTLYHLVSTT
jgi:hypothetical protein